MKEQGQIDEMRATIRGERERVLARMRAEGREPLFPVDVQPRQRVEEEPVPVVEPPVEPAVVEAEPEPVAAEEPVVAEAEPPEEPPAGERPAGRLARVLRRLFR